LAEETPAGLVYGAWMPLSVEQVRRRIPETVKDMAQVVVDNPGQVAVVAAGGMVLTRVMANLMRPRGPLEFLAMTLTCQVVGTFLAIKAVDAGLLRFRVRGPDGEFLTRTPELLFHQNDPACPGHTTGTPTAECLRTAPTSRA
jgi:hypothetical protein